MDLGPRPIDTSLDHIIRLFAAIREFGAGVGVGPALDELLAIFGAIHGQYTRQAQAQAQLDALRVQCLANASACDHEAERWVFEGTRIHFVPTTDAVPGKGVVRYTVRREPSMSTLIFGLLLSESRGPWSIRTVQVGVRHQMPLGVRQYSLNRFTIDQAPPLVLRDAQDGMDITVDLINETSAPLGPPDLQILGLLRRPKTVDEMRGA